MNRHKADNLKIYKKYISSYWKFFLELFLELFLALISLAIVFFEEKSKTNIPCYLRIIFIIWLVLLTLKAIKFYFDRKTLYEYRKVCETEKYSTKMLDVQQRVNEYKTRHVLQITYGNVPKWHSFNYYNNILVYDVHEQIRTILLELKDALIAFTPGLDSDSVTVNLVYCYPNDDYDGILPTPKNYNDKWKLITSRDGSSTNYKVHDFLANKESFFFKLDQDNFLFYNDKTSQNRYYMNSGKDQEYGLKGSIVGLTLSVKNDVPEKVLVKAMLTITTYGRKLNEIYDPLKEDDYIDLFKTTILNVYKSLLESELSQMYIRHMIREDRMCPYSGYIKKDKNNQKNDVENENQTLACQFSKKTYKCMINNEKCNFTTENNFKKSSDSTESIREKACNSLNP